MCDYSLAGVPNRLAMEGEELVVHRFPTGAPGLTSPHTALARSWFSKVRSRVTPALLRASTFSIGPVCDALVLPFRPLTESALTFPTVKNRTHHSLPYFSKFIGSLVACALYLSHLLLFRCPAQT